MLSEYAKYKKLKKKYRKIYRNKKLLNNLQKK